jgi:DNA polymerase-3 subunit delta
MESIEDAARRGDVSPVYVLASVEPLLISRTVAALVAATVPPASRAFNFDQLEGKGLAAATLLRTARQLPMMGKRRLVLVREAELAGAETLAELVPYLDKPVPETVLVLVCGKVDGRLKFFAAAKKKGALHELTVPRQLGAFIQDEVRRAGAKIDAAAARRLEDVVGRDLSRLAQAIEQLALFVGVGDPITVEHIDTLIADTSERTVFQLNDAIGQGDKRAALAAVAKLFEQRESAIGVVIMLARHVRQLALYQELAAARAPAAEIARVLSVPPFVIDKSLAPQSRRFLPSSLVRGLGFIAKADRDLKGPVKAALGEEVVLTRLVERLVELGRSAGATSPARR